MTIKSNFSNLTREAPDPIVETMTMYAQDTSPDKIDVSIGVYKGEKGESYVFPAVSKAKKHLFENDPGHSYTNMAGIPEYTSGARKVVFGEKYGTEGKIASLQTISGTGACHMAFLLLREAGLTNFYVGTPCWSNYGPMITHVGSKYSTYTHYDENLRDIDFDAVLDALQNAPSKFVFLFQACCHNPTGADFSKDQWKQIASIVKSRDLFPVFDIAYQGFSSGDKDVDAWPVRYFYEQNLEFLVCQSFSKNMGLYSERTGCLHAVVQDMDYVLNVQSQLVALFRSECSFAPAYGARIASIIINEPGLENQWGQEVSDVTTRLKNIRKQILDKFLELGTPGKWDHVVKQQGLFWYSGLSAEQNDKLIEDHHIYSTSIGRVNIAGLNESSVDKFVGAIDKVVRDSIG